MIECLLVENVEYDGMTMEQKERSLKHFLLFISVCLKVKGIRFRIGAYIIVCLRAKILQALDAVFFFCFGRVALFLITAFLGKRCVYTAIFRDVIYFFIDSLLFVDSGKGKKCFSEKLLSRGDKFLFDGWNVMKYNYITAFDRMRRRIFIFANEQIE
jgi:hypothetical protein